MGVPIGPHRAARARHGRVWLRSDLRVGRRPHARRTDTAGEKRNQPPGPGGTRTRRSHEKRVRIGRSLLTRKGVPAFSARVVCAYTKHAAPELDRRPDFGDHVGGGNSHATHGTARERGSRTGKPPADALGPSLDLAFTRPISDL